MNPFQTEITKDSKNKKLHVTRMFKAPVDVVWRAWTDADLLGKWWAPRPYRAVTKSMDFREGGRWLYYMLSPEGEKHWCLLDYSKISFQEYYMGKDAFCDDKGNANPDRPSMRWKNTFQDEGKNTRVRVEISFDKEEDIDKIIDMGFKEGFTAAHGNLDELLKQLNS